MGFYYCKGRSLQRVIYAVRIYYGLMTAERIKVDSGKVYLNGDLLATYEWEDDTPVFDFQDETKARLQAVTKPFLDEYDTMPQTPTYIVQCVMQGISLWEALNIRWAKENRSPIEGKFKIIKIIKKACFNQVTDEWCEKHWEHFAECAILEIL